MHWVYIPLFAAVLAGAAGLAVGNRLYGMAVAVGKKDFLSTGESDSPQKEKDFWEEGRKWLESVDKEPLEIVSTDGLHLRGLFLPPPLKDGRYAVLIHGYGTRGMEMGPFARFYYEELKMGILIPDNRGHGLSEGHYIGFGWHDREDVINWLNYLVKREGEPESIILHGISMGGATVLMTSGEALPASVKAVVSDCAYTSAMEVLTHQLKTLFKLPAFPFIPLANFVTRLRAGYSLKQASALEQVKKTRLPILFIHGDADDFVPFSMMRPLYDAAGGPKGQLVVAGAGHAQAMQINGEAFKEGIRKFLEENGIVKT